MNKQNEVTLRKYISLDIFLLIYFQRDKTLHISLIYGKLLYMFRVVSPPIIRSTQLYLRHLVIVTYYCYLPLLWESLSWPDCGVGIVTIGTIPTPHSGQLQLSHNRGR